MTSGNGTSEILTVLQKIEARLANVESAVVEGFRLVREDFADVRGELRRVNERLDAVVANTGAHWRTLDERVRKIEEHLGLAA
jgi:hypothetical protein